MRNRKRADEGFTLVEIAMALLVVAIGMVSIMGLFPAGLQSNQQSVDEVRVAMFAEDVLNGVKAVIEETVWDDVARTLRDEGVPLVGSATFFSDPTKVKVSTTPEATRIKFTSNVSPEEFAMRYFLQVRPVESRYRITLQVWPNEHGFTDLNDLRDFGGGFVFDTEVYHNGRF